MGEIGKGFEPNIISGRDSKLYLLHEDISRNMTPDLSMVACPWKPDLFFNLVSLGRNPSSQLGGISGPLGPQESLHTPSSCASHILPFLPVMFCPLISLPELSLRVGTVSILCLCSPRGIAGCYASLKSSINICRMRERINRMKFKNYSRFLPWNYYSLVKNVNFTAGIFCCVSVQVF